MYRYLIFVIFLICFSSIFNIAEAEDSSKKSSWGTNSDVLNKGVDNQIPVSDSKLKKTIDQIKERSLTKKQKQLKEDMQPLSPLSDISHLKSVSESFSDDKNFAQNLTIMIPVDAYNEEGQWIHPGYYKLSCKEVSDGNYVLELSQGTKVILTVNAKQTKQDLEQDSISFCNAEIIDDDRIRLIYGTINLNLVGYVYIK